MTTTIEVREITASTDKIPVHEDEISLEEHISRYEAELAEISPDTQEYKAKKDIVDYLYEKRQRQIFQSKVQQSLGKASIR